MSESSDEDRITEEEPVASADEKTETPIVKETTETLIEKGLVVIDDRGGRLTASDIASRLSERSNNALFREMGLFTGPQKRFDEKTIRLFAAAFDKAVNEISSN